MSLLVKYVNKASILASLANTQMDLIKELEKPDPDLLNIKVFKACIVRNMAELTDLENIKTEEV